MYAHRVRTWVRKLGPTLLLITCHNPAEPLNSVRYWGSPVLDLEAQALVDILAIRWEVETFFEYEKDLLGSDHYQVRRLRPSCVSGPSPLVSCFFSMSNAPP